MPARYTLITGLVCLLLCAAPAELVRASAGEEAVARLLDSYGASPAERDRIYTEIIKLTGEGMEPDSLQRLVRAVALFQRAMDGEDQFIERMVRDAPRFPHITRSVPPFVDDFRDAAAEFDELFSTFPFTDSYAAATRLIANNWHDGRLLLRASQAYKKSYPVSRFTHRMYLLAGSRLLLAGDYEAAGECFQALWREETGGNQAQEAYELVDAMEGVGGLSLTPQQMFDWAVSQGLSGHTELATLIERFPDSPQCERAYLRIFENVNNGFNRRSLSHNRRNAELVERYFEEYAERYSASDGMKRALLLRAEFNYQCGKKCEAIARKNDYSWRHYQSNRRRATARRYGGFAASYFERVAKVDSICRADYPGSETSARAGLYYARSLIERDRYAEALARLVLLLGQDPPEELAVEIASYAGLIRYHEADFAGAAQMLELYSDVRFSGHDGWQRLMLFLAKSRQAEADSQSAAHAYAVLARQYPYTYYGIRARKLKQQVLPPGGGMLPWAADLPVIELPAFPDTFSVIGRKVQEDAGPWRRLGIHSEAAYIYSHGLSLVPEDHRLRFNYHENFLETGWYHRVLRGFRGPFGEYLRRGGTGLPPNFWDIAYLNPEENTEIIRREGERRGIPPGLITAVIRQESNFNPGARSHAGAVGLMQLLPGVGRRLARGEGIGAVSTRRLYDPDVNIRLGVKFLASNLDKYDGNIPLAISSYNADPRNLPAWLERSHPAGSGEEVFDLDLFIELIPLEETHYYNLIVLTNYWRYQELGGERENLFAWKLLQF